MIFGHIPEINDQDRAKCIVEPLPYLGASLQLGNLGARSIRLLVPLTDWLVDSQ